MMYNDNFLLKKLNQRKNDHTFRTLQALPYSIDFCSNDYLGVVHHHLIKINDTLSHGSTGSRLLAGNSTYTAFVEQKLATFHAAEAALLFNSGYDANIGILSSIPQKGDTILYDYLCHASIRDGIRLSNATAYSFEHNNITDLEKKLQIATGNIFIITEAVFSMDGDTAPLQEIVNISQKFNAHIIIDEAHAIGVLGDNGQGLSQKLNLHQHIFARMYAFGKACGVHGAVVVGSKNLIDYCINFCRSFIYSTALPPSSIAAIEASYQIFPFLTSEREHLKYLVHHFQQKNFSFKILPSSSAIQAIIIPDNVLVKKTAALLQENKINVRAIVYPTVPKGTERLRIILHSFNSIEDVDALSHLINSC